MESSVLLSRDTELFDREVEKLVSVSAARAAATVSLQLGEVVEFDGRAWVGSRTEDVVDYFRWRQEDATRCALNGYCYWTLRREGKSVGEATQALRGAAVSEKNALLFERGINFAKVPTWQRRGSGIYWEIYEKVGFNPKAQTTVRALRRQVCIDSELPMKEAYAEFVRARLAEGVAG